LVRDQGLARAGRFGALAAAEVIQHVGARPLASLKQLAGRHGLSA
jgi:adenosine kinase